MGRGNYQRVRIFVGNCSSYQPWSKNGTIKISDELAECRKKRSFRKCITHTAGQLQPGSQRAATAKATLGYREESRIVNEQLHFVGGNVRSFTDLPPLHERNVFAEFLQKSLCICWESNKFEVPSASYVKDKRNYISEESYIRLLFWDAITRGFFKKTPFGNTFLYSFFFSFQFFQFQDGGFCGVTHLNQCEAAQRIKIWRITGSSKFYYKS